MAAFTGKLNVTIGANTSDLDKKIKNINKTLKGLNKSLVGFGKDFSVMTAPITAVGVAALGVGVKIESAFRTIKIGTGASGAALKGLQEDFKAIAALGPQSFDDSAKAIADLNTMTGATGETLRELSAAVLDASRMMGTDLGGTISTLGKLLNNWNISAAQGAGVLDKLFVASQATGMGMDAIAQGVTVAGGALRGMGLGLDESIALISTLDKAGLNAQQTMRSFSRAMVELANNGIRDTSQALASIISEIKGASTMGEALDIGKKMFGVKAGADLTLAIREGKLEFAELISVLGTASGTIAATAKETMTLGERWSALGNQAAMALEPLGQKIVKLAEEQMPGLSAALSGFALDLDESTIKILALTAAIGPAVLALGAFTASLTAVIGACKTLIGVMAGPAGITVSLLALAATWGTYIEKTGGAVVITDETRDSVDKLTQAIQGATSAQLQSRIADIAAEFAKVKDQADAARAAILKLESGKIELKFADAYDRALAIKQGRELGANKQALAEAEDMMRRLDAQKAAIESQLAGMATTEGAGTAKREAPKIQLGGGSGKGKAGGGKSGPSALDLFVGEVSDRMKYLGDDGKAYIAQIDAMQAKLKPLTDDWKKLQDLRINIDDASFSVEIQRIQDEIRYLGKDGGSYLPGLEGILAGLDPLSDKWKRVQDIITNIAESEYSQKWQTAAWEFSEGLMSAADYAKLLEAEVAGLAEGTDKWRARFSELQNIKASEVSKVLDSISRQFENGVLTNAEYESALSGIIAEFEEFPRAAKLAAEALDAFHKQNELTTVSLERRLGTELKNVTKEFNELSGDAVMGVVDGFLDASIRGGDFGESLRKLGEDIVYTTLKMLILKNLSGMLGNVFGGLEGGGGLFGGMFGFADGGAFSHGRVIPFAKGGVVHRPTVFPMASGAGLMGEAGPEAVMPLERDSHGRLGVVASGAAAEPPTVVVNVINETSQPVTATQTGQSFDEQVRQMVVGVILRDQATNGPITQNFRR